MERHPPAFAAHVPVSVAATVAPAAACHTRQRNRARHTGRRTYQPGERAQRHGTHRNPEGHSLRVPRHRVRGSGTPNCHKGGEHACITARGAAYMAIQRRHPLLACQLRPVGCTKHHLGRLWRRVDARPTRLHGVLCGCAHGLRSQPQSSRNLVVSERARLLTQRARRAAQPGCHVTKGAAACSDGEAPPQRCASPGCVQRKGGGESPPERARQRTGEVAADAVARLGHQLARAPGAQRRRAGGVNKKEVQE